MSVSVWVQVWVFAKLQAGRETNVGSGSLSGEGRQDATA